MTNKNLSCIILSGGEGKRVGGVDKGLQAYRGKPLVQHVIDALMPQVDDIVISANRNIDRYRALGFAVVTDDCEEFRGPLTGIARSIAHCRHDWILVVPCDMPFLPDGLTETLQRFTDQSKLVAVSAGERLQLVFLLHRSLLDSINHYLSAHDRSVMRWADSVGPHVVVMDNENYFYNINTSKQLEA